MHSRILSIYRSTVRNVVFRADNIDDLIFFESVLLDDHTPMFMKLYSCLFYYIDNPDSRDPEIAHPVEQLIIFYFTIWDHIIRNDLASENELLISIVE